ncbi:MAG TPA: diguanylate cyclase [Xanthomonadaceae bacterium]|nr:diguanylate cyclase [Xanthomonadaceae bacterium]
MAFDESTAAPGPLTEGALYRRCVEAHDHHLDVYFKRRDLAAALSTYHVHAIGVGTGRGEWGASAEAMRDVVRRDIEGFSSPVEFTLRERIFHLVAERVVVCQCLLDLALHADAHCVTLRDLRHTLVMSFEPTGEARIAHIHVSFPTDVHGDEEPYPLKEIQEIATVVDDLIVNRTRDLTEAYRKLEFVAIHDRLTGLYNRICLDEKLSQEIKRARRYGSLISVVVLDIDSFKEVNDRHGHLVGDRVLQRLGTVIAQSLRETDVGGRWGGEEFMLILPETQVEQAVRLAERIRLGFASQVFAFDGEDRVLTVSCGVAQYRQDDDIESLFSRADRALYRAKHGGRNRTVCADD